MNKENLIIELQQLNIKLSQEQIEQLQIYADYLIEYNTHTNLTAIKEIDEVYLKHFYDSATLIKAIDLKSIKSLVDIGTGAGFPGMVIKILFPHIETILIDSNNKKINFLNNLIEKLGLKGVKALNIRSEEYAKSNLDKYDLVTARAVSNMRILTELCLPLVKVGGYFIPLKGNIEEELAISHDLITKLNGVEEETISFSLPIENATRNILKIKKVGSTPNGYPRSYDKMKKELKKFEK